MGILQELNGMAAKKTTRKHIMDSLQNLGTATANEIVEDIQRNYRRGIPTGHESGKILTEMSHQKRVAAEFDKRLQVTVYTYLGE